MVVIPEHVQFGLMWSVALPLIEMGVNAVTSWYQGRRSEKMANKLSSTQYQRMVADMGAAGLNPALAYSQGHGESSVMPASQVFSARGLSEQSVNMRVGLAQEKALNAQANAQNASAAKALADADFTKFQMGKEGELWDAGKKRQFAQIELAYERAQAELAQAKSSAERTAILKEIEALNKRIIEFALPEAEWSSKKWETFKDLDFKDWKQILKYGLPSLLQGGTSASQIWRNLRD